MEELLVVLPVLLFSVVVHECAHGYAAEWWGDPTEPVCAAGAHEWLERGASCSGAGHGAGTRRAVCRLANAVTACSA